jgi:hypothetical protein
LISEWSVKHQPLVISLSRPRATIQSHCNETEIDQMTYDENQNANLDIDPAMLIMGLGYATALIALIGWVASFTL